MSTQTFHMCLSIQGALRNKAFKGFTDDHGNPLTAREAKDQLQYLLAMGHKVMPLGECDNFDNQTGCKGHSCEE